MLHVYYIHSGITIIAAYDNVKKNIKNGDDVIIITVRGFKWSFFLDRVNVFDLDMLTKDKGENLNLHKLKFKSLFKQLISWKTYERNLDKVINDIINNQDYIVYLPIYISNFVKHPNCIGYYFLEEGLFAYYDRKVLSKRARYTPQTFFKKLIYPFFGESYKTIDYEGKKFLGSVAITKQAFKWHNKQHVLSDLSSYIKDINNEILPYHIDNIIVTSILFEDNYTIEKCLKNVIKYIEENFMGNIAIKFHPKMVTQYKEKTKQIEIIISHLKSKCEIIILPHDYIVENNILKMQSRIFSLFNISSLTIYAICFNADTFIIENKKDKIYIEKINSIQKCFSYI